MPRQSGPKSNFRCKSLIVNRITALSRFAEPFQNLSNHFKIVADDTRHENRVYSPEYQQGVIEDRAVPFRNGSEFPDEIGELLHMPAADIAQDTLALRSGSSRRLSVFVCVIVMTRRGMSQPRETRVDYFDGGVILGGCE